MIAFQITQGDLDYFPEWDAPLGSWAVYMPVSQVYYFFATEEAARAFVEDHRRLATGETQ
ncbi:MAG: hypothetical protein EOM21_15990 [Gammaproteobacteria bacterium]|nr:hypothetical protein [Gammaproteobacteria bacterium]